MKTKIRLYESRDRAPWNEYVHGHPQGTMFHLTTWKELVEKSFGHKSFYLIAETESRGSASEPSNHDSRISGIFPMFAVKSLLFGQSMVSLPFATFGGILAENDEISDALLKRGIELTQGQKLDYLEIRNDSKALPDLPVKDLYYSFKKEIFPDNEKNLMDIPRKTRRMVRVGMKNELVAKFGGKELLDTFYGLFAMSYRSLGTPVFSKKYLGRILEIFGDNCSVLVIFKDDCPLSGVISFYYKNQVVPYYSGAHPDSRKFAANDFIYWALMSDSAEKGFSVFDFGRSKKNTGPFHFKRHWGFEPDPLKYQYYLNNLEEIPDISPANPKYRKKIELWRKLPLWATKIIGPQIVKNIP